MKSPLSTIVLTAAAMYGCSVDADQPALKHIDLTKQKHTIPDEISAMQSFNEKVSPAVHAIGKRLLYEKPVYSTLTNEIVTVAKPKGFIGTGTVILETEVDGRREYILATNKHVASSLLKSGGYKRVNKYLAIVENINDTNFEDDIRLKKTATYSDRDMAFVRTINAPEMKVADVALCTGLELTSAHPIMTSGIPLGKEQLSLTGTISGFNYYEDNVFPTPGNAYSVDLIIDQGQSGSLVTTPVKIGDEIEHCLVGLIYAGFQPSDSVRLITPIAGHEEFFESFKSIPSKRPSLLSKLQEADLEQLASERERNFHLRDIGIKVSDGQDKAIHFYLRANNARLEDQYMSVHFGIEDGDVDISNITYTDQHGTRNVGEGTPHEEALMKGILNQVILQERVASFHDKIGRTRNENQQLQYYDGVALDMSEDLTYDFNAFFLRHYKENQIPQGFVNQVTIWD